MNVKVFATFAVLAFLVCAVHAQRRNQRNRKQKGNCHMKEVDKCFEKVDKLTNDAKSSELIKTSKGVDQICSNSLEVVGCLKGYMKKCGTPIQRELFEFGTENFQKSVEQFCAANGQSRGRFLQHSPCIHEKILTSKPYKDNCVNPMMATLDSTKKMEELDDRLDASCCAYNRWDECSSDLITKHCGAPAKEAMDEFLKKSFGGMAQTICSAKVFDAKKARCKKLFAPAGATVKGKLSDNPVTKYVASYFGFLFNN